MGAVAHGTLGDAQQFGDLGVAFALLHEQQQHGALIGREVVEAGHMERAA